MKHRTWMLKYAPGLFFEADKGDGGGAPAGGNGNEPGPGDDPDKTDPTVDKKFTQKELEAILAERLEREKKAQEKAAEKARKQAEEDALLKNQEFQKLAEERGKRIAELEPKIQELDKTSETVTRYKGALEKYLEAEKKDLPKHVLTLLEKLDPVEQMEYIAENREAFKTAGPEGVPPSPNPKERKLSEEQERNAAREQSTLYRY